jgi:hypothetical protein
MSDKPDEFHGQGGSFVMKDGKRVRAEPAPRDHPDGNRPRDKDGKPLDEPAGAENVVRPAGPGSTNVKPIRGAKPTLSDE